MFVLRLFIIELKRMHIALPKIAIGYLLTVIFVSAIGFSVIYYISLNGDNFKSTISVYVPENDKFLNFAINAFKSSGKIKYLYEIEKENDKEAVERAVKSGESTAGVVFEEDFVDSVIHGKKNIPINIFISNKDLILKNAVMKFADCYKDILENVQAGIFSVEKIYLEEAGQKLSSEYNSDINLRYVNFIFSKYKYFNFDEEGGTSLIEYYISVLFPIFLTLFSIIAGIVLYSYKKSFYMCAKCGFAGIAFTRNMVLFILLAIITLFLIFIISLMGFNVYINIIPLILAVFSVSVISNAVFFISKGNISGGLILFFAVLFFSFLGGAIIPPSFLPEWIKDIYTYSPIYVIGNQFGSLFNSGYLIQGIFYDICIWIFSYFMMFVFGRKI